MLGFFGLAACRIGGPSANPDQYVAYPDAMSDGSGGEPSGDDATMVAPPDDATVGPSGDDAGSFGDDGGEGDGGCALTVAVCDPIHNTGCDPLHQCDVNTLVPTPPTGLCVFGGTTDAGACTSSLLNETCEPGSTCVDGGCRQLCACNGDCPAGECCSDTSGPPGFTMCRACP